MPVESIVSATSLCKVSLDQLHSLPDDTVISKQWIEQQQMLLDLWASILGVFAHGTHSIEHRLRRNLAYSHAIAQLLDSVVRNLQSRKHQSASLPPVADTRQ
jgi:hypothetical protein